MEKTEKNKKKDNKKFENKKKTPDKQKQNSTKPGNKFSRNITEMKTVLMRNGFEISQPKNSNKIFAKKTLDDKSISSLLLIPIGIDNWISECTIIKQEQGNKRSEMKNIFTLSFIATKFLIKQYS